MLAQLSIQNIVLIKACDINFKPGLNVLTGETGAGKSILLDALGLVLGERSETALIRGGATNASVTAEFDIAANQEARDLLHGLGFAAEPLLVLRRTLTAEGKSRAFINDAPVTVATLKKFGEVLIARQGQHDQRGLLDGKHHRSVLDAFAGNEKIRTAVAAQFRRYKQALAAREALLTQATQAAREEEWLRHTVKELVALDPKEGEEEALAEWRKRASEVKTSLGAAKEALALLTDSNGIALNVRQVNKLTAKLPALEPSVTGALERVESDLEEISLALERLLAAADIDPAAIERAEDRLHALRSAARKYNIAVALLPNLRSESERKLTLLTSLEAEQKRAEKEVAASGQDYRTAAEMLYATRVKAAEKLTKAVMAELKPLKMGNTQLRVTQSELPPASWGEEGIHQIMFEVATNAGMPFGSLGKVASGGELSRLLLAMKVVLRDNAAITSIFDEIDAGTGGAVAEAIGLRLKDLAEQGQVIVVTHQPQVAALAAHHLFISKTGTKEITTRVEPLSKQERAEELARMLSGATISDEARKAATKLLEGAA